MENVQNIRVMYSDTDAYGVIWHGAYVKWFEAARVEFIEKLGFEIDYFDSNNIAFPVVDMDVRYKSSGFLYENIEIKTTIKELRPMYISFEHKVYEKKSQTLRVIAHTSVVPLDTKTGKMLRKMPADLYSKAQEALN